MRLQGREVAHSPLTLPKGDRMPLPISDLKTVWPPASLAHILPKMAQWSAWYTGDLQKLQHAYGGGNIQDTTGFFASDVGGFKATVGRSLQRFFVGEPTRGPDRNNKLPIPIAAEMCQASADLLFADPVTVTVDDEATQERLNDLLDDNMYAQFASAAEICAALGGGYLQVNWDPVIYPEAPFLTIIDADQVVPEFKWGRLWAVTIWSVVKRDGKLVYRHLERHELRDGVGFIVHGLYEGEEAVLGNRISLDYSDATSGLLANPDMAMDGSISTLSEGLAIVYIPNQTPNRIWRTDPIGRNLGRSDLDGVEHLMDQLAEVMSAWVRAIRLAKARIFISKTLLKNAGPGNGNVASLEQEAFTQVESLGAKDQKLADQIQYVQPKVEFDQYKATAETLIEQILQMSGYSMQTFGVGDTGTTRTATEINSKERRSLMTRARKIRNWRPGLVEVLTKLLNVDRDMFGNPNVASGLTVEFSDGVQETQLALANTVQALFLAEAASLHERVSIVHPDWDDDAVQAEVDLIHAETGTAPDPMVPPDFGPASPDQVNMMGATPPPRQGA
jgi:A118 family predicted phage portal protein